MPLRLEAWGPFLFVNPDEDAPPLAETLGPLPDLLPVDDLVFHSRDEFELAANWKIACENYLECYHCPVAHKGFSAAYDVDPDEYRLEPIAEHVLSQFAHTREEGEGQAQFHFVWPNLRINVFAGAPNLSLGPLLPAGPERSSGFLDYFFAPDADPRLGGRAARLRPAGRRRGSRARRAGAEGRALGRRPGGTAARRERAARGALPGARQ